MGYNLVGGSRPNQFSILSKGAFVILKPVAYTIKLFTDVIKSVML